MILQELARYYDRKSLDPDPSRRLPVFGLEDKEIRFVIEIAQDGRVNQLRDTQYIEGKKRRVRSFLVPQGTKKTSGVTANLLWDKAQYVIGLQRPRKNKAKESPHAAFRRRIEELPATARTDAGVRAVLAALDRDDWTILQAHEAWAEIVDRDPLMAFQLVGDADRLVCQRDAVVAAAREQLNSDDAPIVMCLVDGQPRPLKRVHDAIKGVKGPRPETNIVSFNERAFESYGKTERQGENAPIGQRAAFAYKTALNHLLGRDSRQRIQVGDASTVFWADRDSTIESLFSDLFGSHDDPDRGVAAVRALFDSLKTGQLPVGERDARFFVLGLAPNAARLSVRFWLHEPLALLAPRIAQHFHDLDIARSNDEWSRRQFTANDLLAASGSPTQRPGDETVYSYSHRRHVRVAPSLSGQLMQSILRGMPYPSGLLTDVVRRIRAEASSKERDARRVDHVSAVRAAVIRASLNQRIRFDRNSSKEYSVALDRTHTDTFYRLGRLFATYERIQRASADRDLNRTIRDSYFGAAMTSPRGVIPRLARLAEVHLRDIARDKPGLAAFFERELYEIVSDVPVESFAPAMARLEEQARFALGYYHQRHAPKKESTEPTATEEA
jgi:CRISPR-associated protein Csd1